MLFGLGTLLLFGAVSCQQQATVQRVMENEAQRKEVYTMIMENPEMHKEMMQTMKSHHMGDMKGESGMMGKDHKMMGDSAHHRMEGKNMHMMMQMMQQMREKGMMDEACMQKMMQNMQQMKQE